MSTYAYAVTRPFDPALIAHLQGVDGAPVELVGHEDVVAVVSALPPARSTEAELRARLEDLTQLEALARAHHRVVEAVAAHGVTVPFRLATLHSGADGVAEVLHRQQHRLGALLERFAGRVELGVKVYAAPEDPAPAPSPAATTSPGRDYLRHRRDEMQRHRRAGERALALARQVDAELADLADDRRHHRPQDPRLSGADGENILNAAYLVDAGRAEVFIARARQLGGRSVVVTGPWAPYSFAVTDEATEGPA